MTINLAPVLQQLQGVDLTSAAIGAAVWRTGEAALVAAAKRGPALLLGLLRYQVQRLVAAGKIDAATLRMLKACAAAIFRWVDEEMPDAPGPEKMQAAVARAAGIPYLGALVRADRAAAQAILQALYDAVNQAAQTEAATLGGSAHATTPPPSPAPAAPAPVEGRPGT